MRTSSAIAACVGYASLLLLPATSHAEIVFAESTEWVVATSDRVVVGKVVKVEVVADAEKEDCQAITVAVSKTLKGAPADRATFLMRPYIYKGYATQWMDEGILIVFCLVKNDGKRVSIPSDKFEWVARDDENNVDAILLGTSKNERTGCVPVLTREFQVLTEPDAILRFIAETVKAGTKDAAPKSHTLEVPPGTAVFDRFPSLSSVFLKVPVDEKLESLGEKWCKSESAQERAEGAKIFGHFKTEKAIGILKSLLNDPNTAEATCYRSVPEKAEMELVYRKKLYFVRQSAFDALGKLGVKADRPVLEELLEGGGETSA